MMRMFVTVDELYAGSLIRPKGKCKRKLESYSKFDTQ